MRISFLPLLNYSQDAILRRRERPSKSWGKSTWVNSVLCFVAICTTIYFCYFSTYTYTVFLKFPMLHFLGNKISLIINLALVLAFEATIPTLKCQKSLRYNYRNCTTSHLFNKFYVVSSIFNVFQIKNFSKMFPFL